MRSSSQEALSCDPGTVHASECVVWDKEKGFSPYTMEIAKDGQTSPEEYLIKFDYWLLKKSGVEFNREQCTFRGLLLDEKDTVKVPQRFPLKPRGMKRSVAPISADGVGSEVKKILDPSFPAEQAMILAAYQGYYRIVDMGELKNSPTVTFSLSVNLVICSLSCTVKYDLLSLCPCGFKGRNMRRAWKT